MAKIIKAPQRMKRLPEHLGPWLFLAGSIEMGVAEKWQDTVSHALASEDTLTILNPRRDDWDASWVQDISNKQFREQVEWELNGLEQADFVLMVFDKNTKSPITLLELGLEAGRGDQMCVVCPDGFWRKGNVDIVCSRFGINQRDTLEDGIEWVKNAIYDWWDFTNRIPF